MSRDEEKRQRRITLELDPDVKAKLRDLSIELGISQSSIVAFYILKGDTSGIERYLERSDSPAWAFKLNLNRLRKDLGYD